MKTKSPNKERYSMKGFRKVFGFTLKETFKNKAYLFSFVILVCTMTFMPVIMNLSGNAGASAAKNHFGTEYDPANPGCKALTVYNETSLELTKEDLLEGEGNPLANLTLTLVQGTDASAQESPAADSAYAFIRENTNGMVTHYSVKLVSADESEIVMDELDVLGQSVEQAVSRVSRGSGLSASQLQNLMNGVNIGPALSQERYEAKDEIYTDSDVMSVSMVYSIVLMMMVSMSTSFIITVLVEEKTTKLVDMLLVSVSPLALVMGKVLAMMAYVMTTMVCGIIGFIISTALTGSSITINAFDISSVATPEKLLIMLAWIALGYLMFAIMAGIAGSACTRTEDAQSASGVVVMLVMAGYFVALFVPMIESKAAWTVFSLIPAISVFIAPPLFVTERIALLPFLISTVLNILFAVLLFQISARTYRALAMNDSGRMKLGAILKLAFDRRKEESHVS